jgi:biopolymer transport protein ExbD
MPLKIHRDDQTSINLTPMIDIVFLLIIFFMVGSRFTDLQQTERDISLRVPQVQSAQALTTTPNKRVINIYSDGQITLDRKSVTLRELETELATARQQYQKLGVVVRGDRESQFDQVAQVIATCERVKIRDLNIAVSSPSLVR